MFFCNVRVFACFILPSVMWFTQMGTLKKHMLTHTGEKPHVCKICQKGFTTMGSLKQHMLIHTGEKPHMCKKCPNDLQIPVTWKNTWRYMLERNNNVDVEFVGLLKYRRWLMSVISECQ